MMSTIGDDRAQKVSALMISHIINETSKKSIDTLILELVECIVPDLLTEEVAHIANRTGLRWRPLEEKLFWFQSPALHIFSFAIIVFWLCPLLWMCSRNFYSKFTQYCEKCAINLESHHYTHHCKYFAMSVSSILSVCIVGQVYLKSRREMPFIQLGWMLMPCHVQSCIWIYILLTSTRNNFSINSYLVTMLVDCYWAPVLAIASPDTSDHIYNVERAIFFIEHCALLLLPFYGGLHFLIAPMSWEHFCHSALISLFIPFALYTLFSLLTGLNVMYMLYPPLIAPHGSLIAHSNAPRFLQTPLYRFYVAFSLICSSIVFNIAIRSLLRV